jgi:hypothetical protein
MQQFSVDDIYIVKCYKLHIQTYKQALERNQTTVDETLGFGGIGSSLISVLFFKGIATWFWFSFFRVVLVSVPEPNFKLD